MSIATANMKLHDLLDTASRTRPDQVANLYRNRTELAVCMDHHPEKWGYVKHAMAWRNLSDANEGKAYGDPTEVLITGTRNSNVKITVYTYTA